MKMNSEGLEEAEERIAAMKKAKFAVLCGIETVSVGEGEAVVRMPAKDKQNALGTIHGGAIFTLADQAFALAANSESGVQVALQVSVNFLRPAKGDLEARAVRISEGRTTSLYEARVYEGEELVAIFYGTGYKLSKRAK
jgi:acyl-CoA thioesterase